MSYKVIRPFFDKTDNKKPYKKGDSYTHKDEKRIAFLVEKGFLQKEVVNEDKKEEQKKRTRKKASE